MSVFPDSPKTTSVAVLALFALMSGVVDSMAQQPQEVSPPQGVTVSIYDTGMAMISEARRVTLTQGELDLVIRQLPVRMDPGSASFGSAARNNPFDLLEQTMAYDLADLGSVVRRMSGKPVVLPGTPTAREGILLSGPVASPDGTSGFLPVRSRDGKNLWVMNMDEISSVTFPFSRDTLAIEPQLLWRVQSRQEGPQSFRLAYRTDGMKWRTTYDMILRPDSTEADVSARVELNNRSGNAYENARVRLVLTEKGLADPIVPESDGLAMSRSSLRYAYGATQESFDRSVASLAPVEIYELPRTVTLASERSTFVQLIQSISQPIKRFYVYDGVRFDRFQRNRRTDWSFGTEFHTAVQTHIEFENEERFGLGVKLPPGLCRLFVTRSDGTVDMVGEEYLSAIPVGGKGYLRVGPARGLAGERERTGYVEVKPHHVYEESFQIRLSNTSEETVEIRVVEHLYRWPEYQIVRADADYTSTQAQVIEFRVELKPGARRSINYTVRYTW